MTYEWKNPPLSYDPYRPCREVMLCRSLRFGREHTIPFAGKASMSRVDILRVRDKDPPFYRDPYHPYRVVPKFPNLPKDTIFLLQVKRRRY